MWAGLPAAALLVAAAACDVPAVEVPAAVEFVPGRAVEIMLLDGATPDQQQAFACRLGAELGDRGQLEAVFDVVDPDEGGWFQRDLSERDGDTVVVVQWSSPDDRAAFVASGAYEHARQQSGGPTVSASLSIVPPADLDPPAPVVYAFELDPARGYELGSGDPVGPPPPAFIEQVLIPGAMGYGRLDLFSAPALADAGVDYVKGFTSIVQWDSLAAFVDFVTDPESPLGENLDAREAFAPEVDLEIIAMEYVLDPCPG